MCDPVTLALMAGGTIASTAGASINAGIQNDAIRETNRQNQIAQEKNAIARQQEAERQRAMEEQQAADVAKALFDADPAAALLKAQETVAAPQNPITEAAASYNEDPAAARISNPNVDNASASYVADSKARTGKVAEALAMLTAIGGEFGKSNIGIGQAGSRIATTGGFRRGSANVAGQEAGIPAADVTASDSAIGDILMLGGQIAAGVGGGRMGRAGETFGIGDILKRKPKVPLTGKPAIMGGLY